MNQVPQNELSRFLYTELSFDSMDCKTSADPNYSSSDTPSFFSGHDLSNIAFLKVLEAQIPSSFYIINSYNKNFKLTEYSAYPTVRGTTQLVTLSEGYYNSSTFATELALRLSNASIANGATAAVYTASVSALTGKLSITSNLYRFAFDQWSGISSLAWTITPLGIMGFDPFSQALSGAYSAGSAILTAPNILNLSGASYIYLNSTKIGATIAHHLPVNGVLQKQGDPEDGPQLAKIPLVNNAGTVSNWQDPCPDDWFSVENLNLTGATDFFCTLGLDPPNYPMRFNGLGFSFKLGVLIDTKQNLQRTGGGYQNDRVIFRKY